MIQVNRANFEEIYDRADSFYQSFWDSEGSLHRGYFEDPHSTTIAFVSARLSALERVYARAQSDYTIYIK